jgi:hypothetical protein
MNIYQPYTYLIGWSAIDRWYYGVRYGKGCHPTDLWTKYFTSSKYVALLRETHGEPDIITIDETFSNALDAVTYEKKILTVMDVINSPIWINRNIGGVWARISGFTHSEKSKQLMAISSTGIRHTTETRKKMSIAHTGKPHPLTAKSRGLGVVTKMQNIYSNPKGFFITPWGKFVMARDAAQAAPEAVHEDSITGWCRRDNYNIIPPRTKKIMLQAYIGKTYNQAGFSYEKVR